MGTVRTAALWGDEHTELGEIAVAPLLPQAAVALSRGKFPKGYPHLDPNEDAVLAATDGANWLLPVAGVCFAADCLDDPASTVHRPLLSRGLFNVDLRPHRCQ